MRVEILKTKLYTIMVNNVSFPVKEIPIQVIDIFSNIYYNYSDFNLSINNITDNTKISRTQIFEYMKKYTKTSPNELICKIRMIAAIELLCFENLTIFNIGMKCGYFNPRTFRNIVNKYFSKPPKVLKSEICIVENRNQIFEKYLNIALNYIDEE